MTDELRAHCRKKAFFAFGTSQIFQRRAQRLLRLRNWITYLGIVVPILVGAIALSFGTAYMKYVLVPAGVVGIVQLALSVWSLVARWDERHMYAVSAARAQTRLFNAWDALAARPPADLRARVDDVDEEDQRQEQFDLTQHIDDKEKRYAMRAALYQFGNNCERCGQKPKSMAPTDCDACGNF